MSGWTGPEGPMGVPAGMGVRPRRGPGSRRALPARCRQRCDLRRWLVGLPGLEPGTSSLSGFCTRPHSRRIPPATCTKRHRWRPLRTARFRWHVDQTWTRPLAARTPVGPSRAVLRSAASTAANSAEAGDPHSPRPGTDGHWELVSVRATSMARATALKVSPSGRRSGRRTSSGKRA
jgi:hypothetical protein